MNVQHVQIQYLSKIKRSSQKLIDESGYCTFWTSNKNSIKFGSAENIKIDYRNITDFFFKAKDLKKAAVFCNCCHSFLGLFVNDNIPPYFGRFSINSESLYFVDKEYFRDPHEIRHEKKIYNEMMEEKKRKVFLETDAFDEEEFLDVVKYQTKETKGEIEE